MYLLTSRVVTQGHRQQVPRDTAESRALDDSIVREHTQTAALRGSTSPERITQHS